ncbi:tRNA epoxyqueuosine(34) reductase QueG [Gilvibacter sp. SZ-19]|uniref:tRNA epoxyqueuosine(34) reductase QueG n=1 Tax=unclassified Gilvibacter TaxID=2625242 RepID=UPI000B3CA3C4|nr:tRNA epoxyqueuosine(34) reductase QueG [Gilvibacter sp. SZ-19]ARV11538.1 tRNA epoxyqueuosine(34) reductase QueG [Gilvibacter sp. SZ-19]
MNQNQSTYAKLIKTHAQRLGFLSCGISKAEFLAEEAPRLEQWLKAGMHGQMAYMENHFDKRLDPTLLVPGAKSVVSLLYNYYPQQKQDKDSFKISKYAYGEDYHFVVKDKLKELMHVLSEEIGEIGGRVFVDSAPVLDKVWAAKSGLGWIGKHSNLLSKKTGSFFFVAELIIDLDLEYDHPVTDHCGTCTACIDACPTQAIIKPYVVDGSKCISYATIELKEAIPKSFSGQMDDWMFGCDVCQDVCPWNRFSKPHSESRFNPKPELLQLDKNAWRELTEEVFGELFKKSAVKRTKYTGLMRNIAFLDRDTSSQ